MTFKKVLFRRIYDVAAILALAHGAVLGGATLWLVAQGYLSGDKARKIIQVMKGEPEPSNLEKEATKAQASPEAPSVPLQPGVDRSVQPLVEQEIIFREKQLALAHIDKRLALNRSLMAQIIADREALEERLKAAELRQTQARGARNEQGFEKELGILESMNPAAALDQLLRKEPVQAARLLMSMNDYGAKKILESAADEQQRAAVHQILTLMREGAPPEKS